MKNKSKKSAWFQFGSRKRINASERKSGREKARCIHCLKEFKTAYGFHVACKACRTEADYLRSFEWALNLAGAKA